MLAERLVAECGWPVEVFTSCALDHLTWENTEPAGTSVVGGVTVHRFPAASRRRLDYFELDGRIRVAPESASLEISRRWVALNGPMCPELVDAVAVTDADALAATPYLFASTVDAIAVSTVPTVLHPAAHDEPALYLAAFRRSVADLDGLVYYTRPSASWSSMCSGTPLVRRSSSASGSTVQRGVGGTGPSCSGSAIVPISATSAGWTSTKGA